MGAKVVFVAPGRNTHLVKTRIEGISKPYTGFKELEFTHNPLILVSTDQLTPHPLAVDRGPEPFQSLPGIRLP